MRTFAQLLQNHRPVLAPGAFNPFTARLIQEAGFPAVYIGGNSLGISICIPEPLTGLADLLDICSGVQAVVDVPIIADANAGFGDTAHVLQTVRRCAALNIAAIHIEDQPFPKNPGYHRGDYRVTGEEEVLRKLEVAVRTRGDSDMAIIGRTDILRVNDSLDVLSGRLARYAECGVDALMVTGIPTDRAEDVRDAARSVCDLPLFWLAGSGQPELTTAKMDAAGYEIVIYPTSLWVSAAEAVRSTLTNMRDDGRTGMAPDSILAARRDIFASMGLEEYWELEERS